MATDTQDARERMVRETIEARGIADPRLLGAMLSVPRHLFVDEDWLELAYADRPLPIGEGQTISQPFMVATMIDAARLGPGDRVLEVGSGSGYAAAILGHVAKFVIGIERHESLVEAARERVTRLGLDTVEFHHGDGRQGWPQGAPYDAIFVAATGDAPPPALLDQLAEGGRLVMPVRDAGGEMLVRYEKRSGEVEATPLCPVRFVPLV
ncbi:protein-L-isoaspartate(D-aspartate) O-methyltransferase [Sphingomicrobium nitratireducens]|uniref:protein-L-isoaspartate(D-aspartate) O-methyltransferase n=1 Tax=Sphingomicrobium nitratireducens TaxID=2964666 RepID=UPI002240A587|nr:protein-L-isoaspartate(D-aspartate) O-methyltransferase [Sphingomicrobium nitratireducens]